MASVEPLRALPEKGRDRDEVVEELLQVATDEDRWWQTGKCSGTMYSGDDGLYVLISKVFRAFSHVNVLQRDMCPSQTRFEAEIIAMVLDLLGGKHVEDGEPCGVITSGGSESIASAVLAYRDRGRAERDIIEPELILPSTAHPAFRKAVHYFGIKTVMAPVDPGTTQVDVDFVRDHINANTIAMVGSAGNYPYGTLDPIEALSDLAVEHGVGLHVDGCLGGLILPYGRMLGHDIPAFDFSLPGVTSISADTHKYGYGPKGTSVCVFRDKTLRRHQYYMTTDWEGGLYCSPGMGGSRSGGLIAATWAVMVSLGREGYLERARRIFDASYAMQGKVSALAPLRMMGTPSFCFSFTSDEFDIYHVNDFMKTRGWRFNGQQFPSALHMCVTGPQTREGLVEEFGDDLAKGVEYAQNPPREIAESGALYGGAGTKSVASDIDSARLERGLVGFLDSMLEQ
jgi:glutamate/tyrosine decarboxylase-like PLP-dependent enzyme